MVVTATRVPVLVSEAPGTVQVITRAELAQNPGSPDLAELLSLWLGVPVNSAGFPGGVSSLGLRGAGSQQVLILVNGIPIVNPQNGVASLSFLSLDLVDRIEVIQGPLSALYGADAMGGVINIITIGGQPGGCFRLDGTSPGGTGLHLSYQWEKGGFGLGLADSTGERPNSDYSGNWQLGSVRTDLLGWDLELGFYRYADTKGIPGPTYAPSLDAHGEDGQEVYYLIARRGREGRETVLRLYRVEIDSLYRDTWSVGDHEAYRLGAEVQSSWELATNLALVTVGKWEETGVDSNLVGQHSGAATNLAAQITWTPSESLQVYAGDLWSQHSLYPASSTPRLGLVYQVRPGWVLKASYSEAFRAPTFNELYWPADPWSQGNPDLQPETARTWELGLEYQQRELWVAKLSLYHTEAENLIEWLPLDDGDGNPWNDPWSPQNHGRVCLDGLDASLAWRVAPRWRLLGQVHLLRAQEYDPASGAYDLTLATKVPASAVLAVVHGAERWQTAWYTRYYQGHGDVPTAMISDLAVSYRVGTSSRVRFGIQNVWDRDYVFNPGYPMPGRTLNLEWSSTF